MNDEQSSSTPGVSGHIPEKKRHKSKKSCKKAAVDLPETKSMTDTCETEQKATTKLLEYLQVLSAQKEIAQAEQLQYELDKTYYQDIKERARLMEYAEHVLTEVYSDYFVIGHTHDGKTNMCVRAETDRARESLTEALRRYMSSNEFPIV